jgi:hypothetical protein
MKFCFGRVVTTSILASLPWLTSSLVQAQQPQATTASAAGQLTEPVYRLSKNQPTQPAQTVPHSLDPAIQLAHQSLGIIGSSIQDYTAKLVKRERIGDELGEYEFMFAKIRNRKVQNQATVVPFSVYLAFLKPATVKGREVIYVENQNQGRVIAHEGGMKRMLGTHALEPTGWMAMQGQRYPITDIGIENLVTKLIERGERDKRFGECGVRFLEGAKVSERACTVIEVTHPEKIGPYDFHIAQVFLDNEYKIPVRYAAYSWPRVAGGEPELLEEYTYQDINFNVGLTDADFDPNNPQYGFHKK